MYNPDLLRDLVRAMEKNIGELEKSELLCCGVSVGQCYAILEIGLAGGISLIELASLLNLDKSTMSRTVNNLVNRKLVDRYTDSVNRRYVNLSLTEQGREVFDKINMTFDLYLKSVFDTISESKREQVMESIEILIGALKNCKLY